MERARCEAVLKVNLPDYHLHTNVTEDGTRPMLEVAEKAAALGIPEIAITDHYIHEVPGYCIRPEQIEEHFRDAIIARERFGITVRIGVEVDYFPQIHRQIEKFIGSFDFDYILGAGHIVDGYGLASENSAAIYFKKFSPVECYRRSFAKLLETIRSGLFDIAAHLDIVRKYAVGMIGDVPFEEYEDQAHEIADELARSGTGFEVNCRGFDHSPGGQYPSDRFLAVLAEYGIKNITIGSDAHHIETIGTYLDLGAAALERNGFSELCLFEKRNPRHFRIGENLRDILK